MRDVDGHQLQDVGIVVDRGETDLVVVEPNETNPNISYADLNRGRFFANWPIMSHFRQVHCAVDL
jgi:hypothetical protein